MGYTNTVWGKKKELLKYVAWIIRITLVLSLYLQPNLVDNNQVLLKS